MDKITIEYYTREIYGRRYEYIKDPAIAKIVMNLTRHRTIDPVVRELLRDLTQGHITWMEVPCA